MHACAIDHGFPWNYPLQSVENVHLDYMDLPYMCISEKSERLKWPNFKTISKVIYNLIFGIWHFVPPESSLYCAALLHVRLEPLWEHSQSFYSEVGADAEGRQTSYEYLNLFLFQMIQKCMHKNWTETQICTVVTAVDREWWQSMPHHEALPIVWICASE